jgi:hypothetical protein
MEENKRALQGCDVDAVYGPKAKEVRDKILAGYKTIVENIR